MCKQVVSQYPDQEGLKDQVHVNEEMKNFQQMQEMDLFSKRVARKNGLIQAIWCSFGMSMMAIMFAKVFNMVGSKMEKPKVQFKEPNYEKYCPRLG